MRNRRNVTIPKNIIMGIVESEIISKLRNTMLDMDCSGVIYKWERFPPQLLPYPAVQL